MRISEEHRWLLVSTGAAVLAAAVTRVSLRGAWKLRYDEDPPENPASPDVPWSAAIAWAVGTGIAASLGRLLAERGAATGWKRVTGAWPEPVKHR